MQKSMFLVPFLGMALAGGGCSREEQAERHQKSAIDHRVSARDDIRKGRENASEEMARANDKARDELKDSRVEMQKAAEDRSAATADERAGVGRDETVTPSENYDRQPVSGRMMSALEKQVKDQLGDDWTITEKAPAMVIATRLKMKKADDDLAKKVDDQMRSSKDDKVRMGVMANYHHEVVTLRGKVSDCKDAAKMADDFAKIDGINRIVVEVSCLTDDTKAAPGRMDARPYRR